MKPVLDFLMTPTGLGYLALAAAFILVWLSKKKDKMAKIMPIVIAAFNWVEKKIPDNADSNSEKWVDKLDLFLKKFIEEYEKQTGSKPSEGVLNLAALAAERLVFETNK